MSGIPPNFHLTICYFSVTLCLCLARRLPYAFRHLLTSLRKWKFPLSPLVAAHPKIAPVSPIIAAHPKTLDLKSFVCRTYEKSRGATLRFWRFWTLFPAHRSRPERLYFLPRSPWLRYNGSTPPTEASRDPS